MPVAGIQPTQIAHVRTAIPGQPPIVDHSAPPAWCEFPLLIERPARAKDASTELKAGFLQTIHEAGTETGRVQRAAACMTGTGPLKVGRLVEEDVLQNHLLTFH